MADPCFVDAMAARVLAEAERWLGTPYRHQGSRRGVGCDCLGLVRGIWRALYGHEPEPVPPYQPDWAEHGGIERLEQAALRHLGPAIDPGLRRPGDLVLFRWRDHVPAKHAAILAGPDEIIHAYEAAGVVRSPLVGSWSRRIAYVHRFPEI